MIYAMARCPRCKTRLQVDMTPGKMRVFCVKSNLWSPESKDVNEAIIKYRRDNGSGTFDTVK